MLEHFFNAANTPGVVSEQYDERMGTVFDTNASLVPSIRATLSILYVLNVLALYLPRADLSNCSAPNAFIPPSAASAGAPSRDSSAARLILRWYALSSLILIVNASRILLHPPLQVALSSIPQ